MKKIPFYHPASPSFFHISVLLLYILIFLSLLVFTISVNPYIVLFDNLLYFIIYIALVFSALYPFFALLMITLVRKAYISVYQTPVPEEFVKKLVLYNRYLISVIYIFSLVAGFFKIERFPDGVFVFLFFLFILGLCFLFYLFTLPIIIRLILLRKSEF